MEIQKLPDLSSEFYFQTARSSGPGGQNVNKVSTKVELYFDINASQLLNEWQKSKIFEKQANNISSQGVFRIVCQKERSQLKNKELVVVKFYEILKKAFHVNKIRRATKPSWGAVNERIKEKKVRTIVKLNRSRKFNSEE